ncbi:MAG: LysR family transcriptional regulator [Mesorhizobium sp.]|uniref:LysR family transcriptional regulator n=1 Tax=Mesorhizobium sp. TaxID=1871066 RepID=UPI000FE98FA5|nr:LysR family transcriptional regulator [Mesorhizobium sp.]RWI08686.1 MAG: LysR family transcriptional regulator [Mesorhizobium sp.]RWM85683.1 MAG: LysR family transcriptional regulator [Mesorhizobium sp.]TIO14275.1 MAG: LysR family transcriptional regulator [Mesorhizobium sp.]TIP92838.1 MAG: LysR family transcriptional regulator [Mesorhizobium sp.]
MRLYLDFKHLLLLAELADTGSMVEAAERLHVSPSALTHRLREAESRLGVLLAARDGRHLILTPAGRSLAKAARSLVQDLYNAEQAAKRIGQGVTSLVRMACGYYNDYRWFPAVVKSAAAIDPGLQLELVPHVWDRPLAALEANDADVIVFPSAEPPVGFWSVPVLQDELVLVMAPGHPLEATTAVEASDLISHSYVNYWFANHPVSGFEYDRFFGPAKIIPNQFYMLHSLEAVLELVKAHLAISILSRWAIQPQLDAGTLTARPLTRDGIPIVWHSVARETSRDNQAVVLVQREIASSFAVTVKSRKPGETGQVALSLPSANLRT